MSIPYKAAKQQNITTGLYPLPGHKKIKLELSHYNINKQVQSCDTQTKVWRSLTKGAVPCCAVPSKEMLNHIPDVSLTTTLKLVVALLPDPSVKVYVTVVVPTLKKLPGE